MQAPSGSSLCMVHDPARKEEQLAARSLGGRTSTTSRHLAPADLDWVSLHSRSAVQGMLEAVLRLELLGQLSNERARILVRILSAAIRNFDTNTPPGEPVLMPDMDAYTNVREEFVAAAADLQLTCKAAEHEREYNQVSHESARRVQRYKDEDAFDRTPRNTTSVRPTRPLTSAEAWEQWQPSPPNTFDESLINPPTPAVPPPDTIEPELLNLIDYVLTTKSKAKRTPSPASVALARGVDHSFQPSGHP